MDFLDSLRTMAGYSGWMNERLCAVCGKLSDEERRRDRKAFFRSIHGTLNHLLLTDRGWLARFKGKAWPFRSLGQELYADFDELRRERVTTDREIEELVAGMASERLDASFSYENHAGQKFAYPLGPALVHLFNHQTHHRGQVTTLLSQVGIDPGVTDAIVLTGSQTDPPPRLCSPDNSPSSSPPSSPAPRSTPAFLKVAVSGMPATDFDCGHLLSALRKTTHPDDGKSETMASA